MMSIVVRYAQSDADVDILLNQCFTKVALNLDKYDTSKPFKTWMSRVTVNELLDYIRKNKRRNLAERAYQTRGLEQVTYNRGESNLQMGDLLKLLETLPVKSKMVFNLYVMDGFKHREIADKLNISAETSKWHLANARKILTQKLAVLNTKPLKSTKKLYDETNLILFNHKRTQENER